ncbi:TIGR04222 domain-containing membrane protein [Nonomuraea ferruginea]
MAGGPLRVVNTGLAALLGTGRLRLSRGGVLHRVAGADPGEYDVERALLDAVDRHGGRLGVPEARREVSAGREVEAVRHRLQGMALLAGDDQLAQVRTLLRRLRRWSWVTMGGWRSPRRSRACRSPSCRARWPSCCSARRVSSS